MISHLSNNVPTLKQIRPSRSRRRLAELQIGDHVYLTQPDPEGLVSLGAEGEVVGVETTGGEMAAEGRPYQVKFDLRPYARKLGDILPVAPHKLNNAPLAAATLSLGPDDITRAA